MEIREIVVGSQPGQKVSETTISTNEPSMVVLVCNPSYARGGGIGRRITVLGES
jgi:hypothetical protein